MDRLKGKKIAIVCREASGLGGTTTTIVEHARRLTARGCAVDVFGWKLDAKRLKEAGARPVKVPGFSFGSTLKRKLFAALADRATAKGYDLVHGHGDNFKQDVLSLHNCVHAAHEAINGDCGAVEPFKPLDDSRGVAFIHSKQLRERRFKKLIANSRLMKKDLIARFGIPEKMIGVIYPGYDEKKFNAADKDRLRGPTRRELGFADGDVVVGLITSGDFIKRGVGQFIHALSGAKARSPKMKAIVMGKEKGLAWYRRLAEERGVAEILRFLPATPDVARFYHSLDVYVHPAMFEEFGQSVQEAMACGVAVLTNGERLVGAAELFAPQARRWLVEEPERRLKDAIAELVGDGEARTRLAALGPPAVVKNNWDANFAATAAVYEDLLK